MLMTITSIEESEKNGSRCEKEGNIKGARGWYWIAGGLAIYEGDVRNVKKYFGKCAELSPDSNYIILKIPERAVSKAQEYYRETL